MDIYFETSLPSANETEQSTFIPFISTYLPRPSDQMPHDFSTQIRWVPRYHATEFNERREKVRVISSEWLHRARIHMHIQLPDTNTTYMVSLS